MHHGPKCTSGADGLLEPAVWILSGLAQTFDDRLDRYGWWRGDQQHWRNSGANERRALHGAFDQFADPDTTTERFQILAEEGYGCDYHTDVVTNRRIGEQLAARIGGL